MYVWVWKGWVCRVRRNAGGEGERGVERGRGAVWLEMEGPEGEMFFPCEWVVGGVLQSAGLLALVLERGGELEGWLVVA